MRVPFGSIATQTKMPSFAMNSVTISVGTSPSKRCYVSQQQPNPYNLDADPKGYIQPYAAASAYASQHMFALSVLSQADFTDAVGRMLQAYKHFVEQAGGWALLWNDNGTAKSENAAQLLLLGIVAHYCRANNIDISREPDVGRGFVDFKVSAGYSLRALIEVKLARNTKFWHGVMVQTPIYMSAEDVGKGYFIVIVYSERDMERIHEIQERIAELRAQAGYDIRPIIVDARQPDSASHATAR
jgi:hypothetical protein